MLLCFPMGCLKGWILIGAVLTVIIALGMVVGTHESYCSHNHRYSSEREDH